MTPLALVLAALLVQAPDDTARVRVLLDGLRGAGPLACELAMQGADMGWYRDMAPPDADEALFVVALSAGGARITDPAAVPPLVEALDGGDACVARLAVRLLGRARTPAALAALHRRLTAPAPAHRAQAAVGLGYAGQRSAVPRLVALLGDPAPTVREAAAWALGALH